MNAAQASAIPSIPASMTAISIWFTAHWLQIVLAVAAGVLIYCALRLVRRTARKLLLKGGQNNIAQVIERTLTRTSHLFMATVAIRLVAGYANPPALVLVTISFLFTVIVAWQAAIWAREIIIGLIELRTGMDGGESLSNAMNIIRLLVTFAVFAIAVIVVLDNLGVNVTGLVAGLGIGGIAIGLAAQGIFSDLFAALSIIFDKPFRQGETISYDQTTAKVERIGLKSTRLVALSGEHKIISNANLLQKEITSLHQLAERRITFKFGLIYQTSAEALERVPAILQETAESCGLRFVHAGMTGFGASALDYEVAADVDDPDRNSYFESRHRLALAILKRFEAEGLSFAYPTQTSFTAAPDGRLVMPYSTSGDQATS